MKRLIGIFILLVIVGFAGYFIYINYFTKKIIIEDEFVSISEYYIYGDHLNMEGTLEIDDMTYQDIFLNLYDGKKDNDIEVIASNDGSKINFYFSEYINDGLYLDQLERGKYYLFLKLVYNNSENDEEPIVKYYGLSNDTEYNETIYYTMSKYNNKIIIGSENYYNTMSFNIVENKDSSKFF